MRVLLLPALALALTACSTDSEAAKDAGLGSPEASGDIAIDGVVRGAVLERAESRGGEIVVGVSDEVVFMRLSDETLAEAQAEIDDQLKDATGLEAQIGEMVTGAVSGVLDSVLQIPLDDVDAMIYEDGHLYVEGAEGGSIQIGNDGDSGIPFREADARRLINAFERAR